MSEVPTYSQNSPPPTILVRCRRGRWTHGRLDPPLMLGIIIVEVGFRGGIWTDDWRSLYKGGLFAQGVQRPSDTGLAWLFTLRVTITTAKLLYCTVSIVSSLNQLLYTQLPTQLQALQVWLTVLLFFIDDDRIASVRTWSCTVSIKFAIYIFIYKYFKSF